MGIEPAFCPLPFARPRGVAQVLERTSQDSHARDHWQQRFTTTAKLAQQPSPARFRLDATFLPLFLHDLFHPFLQHLLQHFYPPLVSASNEQWIERAWRRRRFRWVQVDQVAEFDCSVFSSPKDQLRTQQKKGRRTHAAHTLTFSTFLNVSPTRFLSDSDLLLSISAPLTVSALGGLRSCTSFSGMNPKGLTDARTIALKARQRSWPSDRERRKA